MTQLPKFERFVRSEFRLKAHFRWLFQDSWKPDQHLFCWASFFLLFSKETEDENNGNKILNNEQVWLRAVKQSFSWPLNQFPLHLHETTSNSSTGNIRPLFLGCSENIPWCCLSSVDEIKSELYIFHSWWLHGAAIKDTASMATHQLHTNAIAKTTVKHNQVGN